MTVRQNEQATKAFKRFGGVRRDRGITPIRGTTRTTGNRPITNNRHIIGNTDNMTIMGICSTENQLYHYL